MLWAHFKKVKFWILEFICYLVISNEIWCGNKIVVCVDGTFSPKSCSSLLSVSYTHLDVYKRQVQKKQILLIIINNNYNKNNCEKNSHDIYIYTFLN